jgi:hypothetical protein
MKSSRSDSDTAAPGPIAEVPPSTNAPRNSTPRHAPDENVRFRVSQETGCWVDSRMAHGRPRTAVGCGERRGIDSALAISRGARGSAVVIPVASGVRLVDREDRRSASADQLAPGQRLVG